MSQEGMDAYPDALRQDVNNLETIGYISDVFHFWGHSFEMRTLTGEEELAASVVCQPYVETLSQGKAWAWANIALSLQSFDGDYEFCPPIGPDPLAFARARFKYCTAQWRWPLAERLFQHYVDLQRRAQDALEAMRDFTPRSQPASSQGLGSLTDLGISPDDLAPEED